MCHLGIDIGGTKVILRVEGGAHPSHETTFHWPSPGDVVADLDLLACTAVEVRANRTVTAVGVAMPATLDSTGRVLAWPNRPAWVGLDFEVFLRDLFPGAKVSCADDGDLAAVAEAEDVGLRSVLYLGVGTGIGGGIVLDGRPLPGLRRGSCEVGHMVVDRYGPRCDCGRRGCVQACASGPATLRRAAELANADISPRQLREAWLEALPWAISAVDESCAALAAAIVGITELVHPELARIGGGFAGALPGFVAKVGEHVTALARPGHPAIPVEAAAFGTRSSLYGSVLLAKRLVDQPAAFDSSARAASR